MIQAAPFILPIAEALGLSVATLGMAKVTDEVNKYIQENPEQAQKLITTLMPAQGIASMFKGKDDDNLPEKVDEDKKKEEPPEDPDFIPEILNLKEVEEREEVPMMDDYATEEDFLKALEEHEKWFPFSKEDFEKGSLDNKIIKKAFEYVKGDDHNPPQPFDRDKFYITPPRGQQEIALKFLKQKLIEDKADPKIIDHITTLQKELSERIENTGYYGAGEAEKTPIGKALSEGFGYVKDLKRKKNAKGGFIDKPLSGGSRYI